MKNKEQQEELFSRLEEFEEIEEINLLTEDDPAAALKKGIGRFLELILRKTIARVDDLGDYEDVSEIEEVINRNRRRQQRLKKVAISTLGIFIAVCAISISVSLKKFFTGQGIGISALERVEYLIVEGQHKKALKLLNQMKFRPSQKLRIMKALHGYYKIAGYYFMTPGKVRGGNIKQAMKVYETILMKFPTASPGARAEVHFRLGRCFEELGIYRRAIENFSVTAEIFPGSKLAEEAGYRVGINHFKDGSFDQAREVLYEFVEKFPNSRFMKNAYYMIGDAYLKQAEVLASRVDISRS